MLLERASARGIHAGRFCAERSELPSAIGNFSTRFSGQWLAFDSFKTQKEIHRADLFKQSASSSAMAVDQRIVFRVVGAYSKCCMRSAR